MEGSPAITKMKVADLKKELRARGLSVVGNKNDLVERLQEAMECGGDNVGLEGAAEATEGGEEDFDEEEILGEEELDSELTPQEEEAALKGASLRVKDDAALLEPTEKKKISLKRTQPTPLVSPDPAPAAPAAAAPTATTTPPEESTPAPEEEVGAVEGQGEGAEGEAAPTTTAATETTTTTTTTTTSDASSPPPKKIIKLDAGGEKDLKARAERFGIPLTETARKEARLARFGLNSSNGTETNKTEDEKRAARMARFGAGGGGGGGGGGKISMEGEKVEIDRLMKRAERFGEVTSPALLKATEEEKKKQRMERFGASSAAAATTNNEGKKTGGVEGAVDELLTKRKERFGIIDEEEKKRKRAERFAI